MKLSILNLAPVREGQTYLQAVESMVNLAKHAENIGIERYWIAEHHNMKNLVSSATALLIQHTLANTKTLRVGSGGVMLPNHSPYVVAEQYGTLETLYPNHISRTFSLYWIHCIDVTDCGNRGNFGNFIDLLLHKYMDYF